MKLEKILHHGFHLKCIPVTSFSYKWSSLQIAGHTIGNHYFGKSPIGEMLFVCGFFFLLLLFFTRREAKSNKQTNEGEAL